MPENDPLKLLIAFDRWATDQVLVACDRLSAEQFHRRFEMGQGSLHDILAHVITVIRLWTESLDGREPRPRLDADGNQHTVQELRVLLDQSSRELAGEAHRLPGSEIVERRTRDGRVLTMTRSAVVAHVATHSVHHRAQCLNMLRQLGVSPLPPSSVAEWTWVDDENK